MSDHKTLAADLLGGHYDDPRNPSNAAYQAATAHAILSLAEQQRIANLIAYVALLESQYRESATNPTEFDQSTKAASVVRHRQALALIRQGLEL